MARLGLTDPPDVLGHMIYQVVCSMMDHMEYHMGNQLVYHPVYHMLYVWCAIWYTIWCIIYTISHTLRYTMSSTIGYVMFCLFRFLFITDLSCSSGRLARKSRLQPSIDQSINLEMGRRLDAQRLRRRRLQWQLVEI